MNITPSGADFGLVLGCAGPYNGGSRQVREGMAVQMDDRLKQLLRELGHAINDTVSDSERIAEAIAGVRAAGFDIVLRLDATIGLARRDADQLKMTVQDRKFLESLHIRVDEEVLREERAEAKQDVTVQDIKFLKSLKISLDETL